MSTPKISFKVPQDDSQGDGLSGDVTAHDIAGAPGKEREREPLFGGDTANISNPDAMDIDTNGGGGFVWVKAC